MIIKESGAIRSHLNFFYLFGKTVVGLTNAFAYVLSANQSVLFSFLKELGIHISDTENNFSDIEISVERKREEGLTGIEIFSKNAFHVIIEAEVGNNKFLRQKKQYLSSFENVPQKVLCFISQTNEFRLLERKDIKVKNLNWQHIDSFLDERVRLPKNLLKDGTREKGRDEDWISAMIPPDMCVSFEAFIKHMTV